MASGVEVDEACVTDFKGVMDRKYRGLILKMNEDYTKVQVEKTFKPSDNSPEDEWNEFKGDLPDMDCRFFVYDFAYEHQGANKTRVLFVFWTPDDAKVRSKTIYASSHEGVSSKLEGVQRQMQITDEDGLSYATVAGDLSRHTAGY